MLRWGLGQFHCPSPSHATGLSGFGLFLFVSLESQLLFSVAEVQLQALWPDAFNGIQI
jgi:hypothetical protein